MGDIRKEELYQASAILKDGFGKVWNCNLLTRIIEEEIHSLALDLVSTSILRKYSGAVDFWLSILYTMKFPNGKMHCLLNERPYKSYVAMAQHQKSKRRERGRKEAFSFVWYRKEKDG
ncbi:hypothetical protein LguiA_014876 [Lonicera macranthoides]